MSITTIEEVRSVAQITNEFTDEEIQIEIDIVESELYDTYKLPKRSQFTLVDKGIETINYETSVYTGSGTGSDAEYITENHSYSFTAAGSYYIYPDKVREITRFFVSDETNETGYSLITSGSDTWEHTNPNNYLIVNGSFYDTFPNKICRVTVMPEVYSQIAKLTTALNLIEGTTIINGESIANPLSEKLKERLERYKKILKPKSIFRSSNYENYDPLEFISYSQSDLRYS